MNTLIQAIGIPVLLGIGFAFFLFLSWASHRRKVVAASELDARSDDGEKQADPPEDN
jgi:hypothetical protein